MRLSLEHSTKSSVGGFTLVEMLVIAPIAMMAIAIIVSFSITLIGDALIAQGRATVSYDTQDALDRIEQDSRLSSAYLSSFSILQPGQGRNATSSAMTDTSSFATSGDPTNQNNILILNQVATTTDSYTSNRDIVYYNGQPNDCASATYYLNRQFTVRVIYFLRDDGTGSNTVLWRRVVVPDWNTNTGVSMNMSSVCAAPWQRDSCPKISTPNCQTVDERMLDHVSQFSLTYYTPLGIVTSDSRSATSIQVNLATTQTIAGKPLQMSSTLRATRTNDTLDSIPAAPVVNVPNPLINSDNNPIKRTFGWSAIPYASFYQVRYRTNGGTWTTTTTTATKFAVGGRPLDIIDIGVTAVNDLGQSSETLFTSTIPLWTYANLQGSWQCYDSNEPTYRCPAYTLLTSDVVVLAGLPKGGAQGETIFTLPVGLRPKKILTLNVIVPNANEGSIDVRDDGSVSYTNGGDSGYISLDNVRYLRSDATPPGPWTTASLQNGWGHFGGSYGNMEYAKDSMGRVHVSGRMTVGTTTAPTTVFVPPTNYQERGGTGILTGITAGPSHANFQISSTAFAARGQGNSWTSIYAIYPSPTSASTANAITPGPLWANYGGSYTPATYSKAADNLVSIQGLIIPNTVNSGSDTLLFSLPAGYCPNKRLIFSVADAGGGTTTTQQTARIDIRPSVPGCDLVITASGGNVAVNKWLSIDGISYYSEK